MAKQSSIKVKGVKASTFAMFQGTFAAVVGLAVAILHSLEATVKMADSTESVLAGLAFGIATGVVSIIVVPLIYFGIGWVIGYIQGWFFSVIAESAGGIELHVEE